ncbi:MAG: sulfatase [Planctomycetota bacterium]|jgi:arylsulfatase A-like enzyme
MSTPEDSGNGAAGLRAVRLFRVQSLLAFASLGMLTGLIEASITQSFGLARGHFLFIDEQHVWIVPTAETIVFTGMGGFLLVLSFVMPRRSFLFVGIGFGVFFATFSVLNHHSFLYWWATVILALGVALQSARLVHAHPERFLWIVRRAFPLLFSIVALLVAGTLGRCAWREHRALAQLPAPSGNRPNVVLVVLDTVRADSLSTYGAESAATPQIGRLARQGILFDHAVAPAPWTLTSHASMFTGRYPDELSADWFSPLDERYPTLAEVLSKHGYESAGFVANTAYCSRSTGLARGFTHYEDYKHSLGAILCESFLIGLIISTPDGLAALGIHNHAPGWKTGHEVTQDFLSWLGQARDRPFFAFLNYLDAHDPYLPEKLLSENRELTPEEKLLMKRWRGLDPSEIAEQDVALARACYASLVWQLDREVGRLVRELQKRRMWDDTIFILTSDHGELFGEHGVFYHGNSLYRPAVQVPLLVCWPKRITSPARVGVPVTLRDLPSTILDMAGLDDDSPIPGNSLAALCLPDAEPSESNPSVIFSTVNGSFVTARYPLFNRAPVSKGTMHSLLDGNDYLIREGDGTRRAYDFGADPHEEADLWQQEGHRDRLDDVDRRLDAFLQRNAASRR